jgi:hypothetical protein
MSDDTEYENWRQAAFLQFFRVAAIVGALLGATATGLFGFVVASLMSWIVEEPVIVPISGYEVPILIAAQWLFAATVIREVVVIMLKEEPEWRKIEK